MQHKKRKDLHKYLMQAATADDVTSNHAYGRVAKTHRPIPQRRPVTGSGVGAVASYRDSMVGSVAQYRGKPHVHEKPAVKDTTSSADTPVLGNRPKSGSTEKARISADPKDRRHHFIEPPKRGFNRFG